MADFGPNVEQYNPSNRIKLLSNQASSVNVDPAIPIKRYFRSSTELMRMAKVYYAEGSLEQAFVLYQKYLSLNLEVLPKHPGYAAAEPEQKKLAKRQCKEIMRLAEEIHQKLKSGYDEMYKHKQHEESVRLQQLRVIEEKRLAEERRIQDDLKTRQAAEEEARRKQAAEEEDRKFAMYLSQEQAKTEAEHTEPSAPPPDIQPAVVIPPVARPQHHVNLPSGQIPYPQVLPGHQGVTPHNIPAPSNQGLMPVSPPSYGDAMSTPSVDRSTKPVHFTQTNIDIAGSDNKYGLKTVRVPITVAQQFAQLAKDNTLRNTETCGLLFGKLERNAFHITHVLIPHQKGAPDSCDMLNEEDIFMFADQHELLQLGWIHTHPTQTAFLSSVDLHTHAGYQMMMPEAIAIVVAPKFDEVGVFQLTPDHGLGYISRCTKPGFHPHPKEPPLFQTCEHVKMDSSYQAVFTDLRR